MISRRRRTIMYAIQTYEFNGDQWHRLEENNVNYKNDKVMKAETDLQKSHHEKGTIVVSFDI